MKQILQFFTERGVLVNLIALMLLLGGIVSALSIQREAFPSVNFDVVVIGAAYPGTSPREIEMLLVNPIERELKGIDGIDDIRSTAYAGRMQMNLQIDPNYKDRSRLVSDVQLAINRTDLPNDMVADPVIMEIKSEQAPILSLNVFGDFTPLQINRLSDQIETDLLAIKGVAKVLIQGHRREEIRIILDPKQMRRHRVSVEEIMQLVRGWNVNAPGGRLKAKTGQKMIRIEGEFVSAADAAQLVIRANERGNSLYLGDIAQVIETLERPTRYVGAQGENGINMIILKKGDADLITLVDNIRAYLETVPDKYSDKVKVRVYNDFSIITRLRLGVLTGNGAIGLALVLLTLLIFLRPAVALTTALGLPIIFFAGLTALYIGGVTLNLLTMFGFIMVLGLMVDDAIIVGENTTYHMEQGMNPLQAAVEGTYELLGPVTATVLTTMIAFLPLMFMDDIIGKFIYSIPIVVITLLAFSLIEALFILPNHIRDFANAKKHPPERKFFLFISDIYISTLRKAVKWRYLTVVLTILALVASLALAGHMKFQLFPAGAETSFYLRVTMPTGSTLEQTWAELKKIDQAVRQRIDAEALETTTLLAGENSADQREALKQIGDRYGFVQVVLIHFTKRSYSAYGLMEKLEKEIPPLFPKVKMSFAMQAAGPPVGRALQVEINSSDKEARERVTQRLSNLLRSIEGVYAIESDLDEGDPEMHIVLDRKLAAFAGIDLASVALHVKAAFDGLRVSTLKQGKNEVDVTIRYPEAVQNKLGTLMQLQIPNRQRGLVPLHRIASIKEVKGSSSIRHKNNNIVLNVSAEVRRNIITSRELNAQIIQRKNEWLGDDEGKVMFHLGGEQERSQESVIGLGISFLFALLGIFVILAIQFNSVRYPLLVMLAIPFGLIGIVVGFFLHGAPLSFMSMMGFVALTGVVVNSSLVMTVFIQRKIQEGSPWREAVIESGQRRLRAVLLTTITTVVGLLPTAYGWGGHDPFVAPMALALSWGLLFSTFITLFSVPAALGVGMDIGGLFRKIRGNSRHEKIPDV